MNKKKRVKTKTNVKTQFSVRHLTAERDYISTDALRQRYSDG